MGRQENPYPLRIEKEVMDQVRILAKENGRSLNKQIEYLLRQYLASYEKEHGPIAVPKE